MSIFAARPSLQLLKKQAGAALRAVATDCLLCGMERSHGPVCTACAGTLERIGACCVRCALPLPHAGLCGACLRDPPAFASAVAVFAYRFPLDRLVQRYKYAGDLAVGRWLAEALASRVAREPRPDLLVAPPVGKARLRQRGFNQALEIAKVIGRDLDLRVAARAVGRTHEAAPQAALAREARHENLRGAFRCEAAVQGLDVVVVDDVVTTGATAEAMARALAQAGARSVRLWAVARTPEPGG